jgi:kynurenine 3-monooxygenase
MKKIVIIGAGLVGSLLAVRLRQLGHQVRVFEKRSDIRKKTADVGRSINLVITSRGIQALKEAGLLNEAIKKSVPVFGRMMHSKTGETVYQPYGLNQECNLSISRSILNQFLLDEAEKLKVELNFNSTVVDIDFESQWIQINDQNKIDYDFVFATDGSGSTARRKMIDTNPSVKQSVDWLPVDYKELFLPVPTQPAEKEIFNSAFQKDALHIWPRGSHMMMALANLDGSFTVTLYLPKGNGKTEFNFAQIKSEQQIQHLFNSEFADSIKYMPNYVSEFKENPQGTLGTVKLSKWTDAKSYLFLGDAAHAIVPFFGQGTNLGFEDVSLFLKLLNQNNYDWTKSLMEFESLQKPNADAIADMAVENWFEMSERVADPKFLLRKKVEAEMEKRWPDLFKSRYGLVTYTLTPYFNIKKAGLLQDELLNDLLDGLKQPEDILKIDWAKAQNFLKSKYAEFRKVHSISNNQIDFK